MRAVTALIATARPERQAATRNSRAGSVYIVKPKMHGPEEVAFADDLFAGVEDMLGLPRNTLKMGIMDEERRTTANLKACIRAAQRPRGVHQHRLPRPHRRRDPHLDRAGADDPQERDARARPGSRPTRTGTSISAWHAAAAASAQIGKGMWAMPDRMADMLAQKIGHPRAGANTAWVPSPTAATLHALHYHQVDVAARQDGTGGRGRAPARRSC